MFTALSPQEKNIISQKPCFLLCRERSRNEAFKLRKEFNMLYEPEYKSPISLVADDMAKNFTKKVIDATEEKIVYCASLATEIKIDADELKKALKYDREQYEKGYVDGYKKGRAVTIDAILSMINTIKGTEENDNDEF